MEKNSKNQKITAALLIIYIILYLSYVTVYVSRQNLSVATPVLKELKIMDAFQIGVLGTIFSIVYSIGRLVNGRIGDKIKPKYMISTGLLLICASNFAFGFFPGFQICMILWGINAIGQSMLWGPILRTLSGILPQERITKLMSFFATAIPMGTVAGILISTGAIRFKGVSFAFYVPSAISLILAVTVFIVVGRIGKKYETSGEVRKEAEKGTALPLKQLLKDKMLLSTFIPTFFHGIVKENINLWLSLFFVSKFSIDLEKSTLYVFMIPLIGMAGRLIYPFLFRIFGRSEYKVNIFAFGVIAASSLPLIFIKTGHNPIWVIIAASLCLGLISAAVSVINHSMLTMMPLRFAKYESSSTVSGIIDFLSYAGAASGSLIYGALLDKNDNFHIMFISWITISLISILLSYISHKKISLK